jgi:hypothetical protein
VNNAGPLLIHPWTAKSFPLGRATPSPSNHQTLLIVAASVHLTRVFNLLPI